MFTTGRKRRQVRVRKVITGSTEKPRVNVFRSNKYIYAQIIDDFKHVTLAQASDLKAKKPGTTDSASTVGKELAEKAIKAGVKEVVFDRAGYKYHGIVKALAESARQAGLKF
jgi:large subunit ribosomal protein L18